MPNINSKSIEIGHNHIHYYDETLTISNISRTYIFRFQNKEKARFEQEQREYENNKRAYEANRSRETKNYLIAGVILALISFILFATANAGTIITGIIVMGSAIGCFYFAYKKHNTDYHVLPPKERPFPEKYGLCIEMTSNYSAVFTAMRNEGLESLRNLQQEINDAHVRQEVKILQMGDIITVENNSGIINTGNETENKIDFAEVN